MSVPSGGCAAPPGLNFTIDLASAFDENHMALFKTQPSTSPMNIQSLSLSCQPFVITSQPFSMSSQPFTAANTQTYSIANQPLALQPQSQFPVNNQQFSMNTQSFTICTQPSAAGPSVRSQTVFPLAGQSAFLSNISSQNIMSICGQPFVSGIPPQSLSGQPSLLGNQTMLNISGQSPIMSLGSLGLNQLNNPTLISPSIATVNPDLSSFTTQQTTFPVGVANSGMVGNQPFIINPSLGSYTSQPISNPYQLNNSLFLNPGGNIGFPITGQSAISNAVVPASNVRKINCALDASLAASNCILIDDNCAKDNCLPLLQDQPSTGAQLTDIATAPGGSSIAAASGCDPGQTFESNGQDTPVLLDWDVESKMVDDADDVKSIEEGDDGTILASGEEVDHNQHDDDKTCEVASESEELEFNWDEYMETVGATPVPNTAFKHVECSIQSGFVKGMKLEVPNKSCPNTYWIASVVMTCGQLLRLRYDGYDKDISRDFWCDLSTAEIHPIGWCAQNGQTLKPPQDIQDKYDDWGEFLVTVLTGARTAPDYLLQKRTETTPIDKLKLGMCIEVQRRDWPTKVWVARILENVGGRLYLRYEGAQNADGDFWLFYLDLRLHPVGWGRERGYPYEAPPEILGGRPLSAMSEDVVLKKALSEANDVVFPSEILNDQAAVVNHSFFAGWKLELIHPGTRNVLCPGTVLTVVDDQYFIVEVDDLTDAPRLHIACHARSPTIFPVGWGLSNGLKLVPPKGWSKPDFSWSEYLTHTNANAAPKKAFLLLQEAVEHEFCRGMKLEAVNASQPDQVCVATIVKIIGRLLWIHIDSRSGVGASHIEDIESMDLFPVGWCESNRYQLKPPRSLAARPGKQVAVVQPELSMSSQGDTASKSWCPKIYFNHRCFSGRYLNKGQIAELPKSVGPGSMLLVIKEVLSMLIRVAYKSCRSRVLSEIQLLSWPNAKMQREMLEAKYKNKSYIAEVEICRTSDQLEDFLRGICIKLECCPNLISPHVVPYPCPENCSQLTKTKYNYYYSKMKRKIGRPPGSHSNRVDAQKHSSRRRHRKKIHFAHRKTRFVAAPSEPDREEPAENLVKPIHIRRVPLEKGTDYACKPRHRKIPPPPSDIQTRGAKKPKFSFERKTHKKIMASPSPPSPKVSSGLNLVEKAPVVTTLNHDVTSLKLNSNPLGWSISNVADFMISTDCAHLAKHLKEQEIDGQAFLLLTLPTVQEHLHLKLGPAIKLCHLVEKVKVTFYDKFAA